MNIRKNILLSVVSLSFVPFLANAQDTPTELPPPTVEVPTSGPSFMSKVVYGGKIGIGSSTFSKELYRVGPLIGMQIGGFVNYKVIDMLTVQLEVLYMQQGGKEYSTGSGSQITGLIENQTDITRITLHNLEIPLLAKITPPVIGSIFGIKWHALIGPSLGINLGATTNTTSEVTYSNGSTAVFKYRRSLSPNNYETMQWGGYIGAGIETELKSFLLTIDVRYRQGLNTINQNYNLDTFAHGYGNGKSNTIAVTLGIGLKK